MITKAETHSDRSDIWSKLSAPLPSGVIEWRQDGKPVQRDGKFVARFVAYIDAQTVRERLDSVVPGEWDLTLELLPTLPAADGEGVANDMPCAFKARLQILGVIREDVGHGRDYKAASTDAFKRTAVRFGIAHELYSYEQNWVQVDGDGRYAKPLEDPGTVYARRQARAAARANGANEKANGNGGGAPAPASQHGSSAARSGAAAPSSPAPQHHEREPEEGDVIHDGTGDPMTVGEPSCPKCGGRMWDNRLSKRNTKAPDFKCRSRSCDGVIWPPKPGEKAKATAREESDRGHNHVGDIPGLDNDEIPF